MLNVIRHPGPDTAPPLLIAHGLYGSGRNWGVIARRLAAEREVLAVDQRNHGNSPWTESHGYEEMAEDLAEIIGDNDINVLGHSMGGKAAMVLALTHPGRVNRLIVADIAPVAYAHSQMPVLEAMRAVDLDQVARRSDAEDQLAAHLDDPTLRSFLTQSLDVKQRRWRLNLDVLARDMDRILSFPDIDGRFDGKVLFLSGAQSDYVRPEHRDRIKSLFPRAVFAKIPGAGHWLHAERPREFEAAVSHFLR